MVPLFIVTMASQNVTGMTVLAGYAYRPRLPPVLAGTGAATAYTAPFGGHALTLAAISAALTAGPDGARNPARRWIAAASAGVSYVVLGLGAGLIAAFAAVVALVVSASGIAPLGVSAPFWGLVAGIALLAVQHRRAA